METVARSAAGRGVNNAGTEGQMTGRYSGLDTNVPRQTLLSGTIFPRVS